MTRPVLHMLCGKMASGKSTLAAKLAAEPNTVMVAEDIWIARLYEGEIKTGEDFLAASARLRAVMGPHVVSLLRAGVSVVLDFQANTVRSRSWMRGLLEQSGAAHRLHVLQAEDDLCLARLKARNEAGTHVFAATEEQFHAFTRHHVEPSEDEGFDVLWYPSN